MPAATSGLVEITDCAHGMSDWFPPRLDLDRICLGWNIEFWKCAVAGRRNGTSAYLAGTPGEIHFSLFVHTPTTTAADDRLAIASAGGAVRLYNSAGAGTLLTQTPNDAFDFSKGVSWASLHGKLFIAAKSNQDRLHVYDGTTIRRAGLSAPPPPVLVQDSGVGAFLNTRQYRLRVVRIVGGVTVVRSEPSTPVSFTPSGFAEGAQVIFPDWVPLASAATHWEVEEIAADSSWYRINPTPLELGVIGSYIDTLALSAVPTSGVLSADIGDYTVPYSAQWLAVDEDRLLLGGAHDQPAKSARVSWTPLGGAVGVGNDERLPTDVEGFLDFDTLDGGGLTGLVAWEGKVIVFKRSQVHQMVRSSSRLRAYLPDCLSRRHGAVPGSIVEGTDDQGLSCLYFLDYDAGPMQLGFRGLRVLAPQLQETWREHFHRTATVPASVTYHPEKRQVWWHVALDANTHPNQRWMYSVETDGTVLQSHPHPITSAVSWLAKPRLLVHTTPAGVMVATGDDPLSMVEYDGSLFRAYLRTRGYQLGGLLRRWEIGSAILEVNGGNALGTQVSVTCVRDYGAEVRTIPVPVADASGVAYLTIPIDNVYLTEGLTMQFDLGDAAPIAAPPWQLHGFAFTWSLGSPSTGRG